METIQTKIYCSLLQVTGDSKEWTIVDEGTSIRLSFPSQGALPLPFPLKQLSCHLTDPWNKQVPCSITPTQLGVCTVMYTPTIHGPHQLRIKIKDTNIQGSPFKVNVLPKAVRGVVQHITEIECSQRVAVSKSGDVVVSHGYNRLSVFNRKGEKKLSFRPDMAACCAAITVSTDNHILAVYVSNSLITEFTMEGSLVKSVDCRKPQDEFYNTSSITVHPSGKVVVAGSRCRCIQVLNPDLTHSHLFSIRCDVDDDFISYPHVACGYDGVVYVAGEHCIRSFNIDGQYISKYSYNFTPGTHISGICIDDSTNTLYVSDEGKKCVSVLSSSGKFIKCLNFDGIQNKRKSLAGIAIDNSTGALYVCDNKNDLVYMFC